MKTESKKSGSIGKVAIISIVAITVLTILLSSCSFNEKPKGESKQSESDQTYVYEKAETLDDIEIKNNPSGKDGHKAILESCLGDMEDFYSCWPNTSGNLEMLIKFTYTDGKIMDFECYEHTLRLYGIDDYEHFKGSEPITYNEKEECFEMEFAGTWRFYRDCVKYAQPLYAGTNPPSWLTEEYDTVYPVNPDDYWWYDNAKRQTGEYEDGNTVHINGTNTYENLDVGSTVAFGKYEMDDDTSNGLENIVWEVIDKEEDKVLIISQYCLFCQESYTGGYQTWEKCPTRKLLNGSFYDETFTEEEKQRILTTKVINKDNEEYETSGGKDTNDKIFLLSIDEVNKYFPKDEDRYAYATLSAQKAVDEDEGKFDWWLRSPGRMTEGFDPVLKQSYVKTNGFVSKAGTIVNCYNLGIRPAMWISIT